MSNIGVGILKSAELIILICLKFVRVYQFRLAQKTEYMKFKDNANLINAISNTNRSISMSRKLSQLVRNTCTIHIKRVICNLYEIWCWYVSIFLAASLRNVLTRLIRAIPICRNSALGWGDKIWWQDFLLSVENRVLFIS